MFLRPLSSSFLPHGHPALLRAGFRSRSTFCSYHPQVRPAPPPWWPGQGFPPWHAPTARQNVPLGQNTPLGHFAGSWRPFHASAGPMERPDRDRAGPPYKRRKSAEEKRNVEETEGAGGKVKQGGPRKEHHRLDPGTADSPRSNQWCKDKSQDRGKSNDEEKGGSRANSRDKGGERSRTGNRDGDRGRHTQLKDGPADRGRSHEQGGRKDSQPAGGSHTRTQSSGPKPSRQDSLSSHNPWFKDRGRKGQGGHGKNGGDTGGEPGDRSKEGGGGTEPPPQPPNHPPPPNPPLPPSPPPQNPPLPPNPPPPNPPLPSDPPPLPNHPLPPNPWLAAGARGQPAPQDCVPPARREFTPYIEGSKSLLKIFVCDEVASSNLVSD